MKTNEQGRVLRSCACSRCFGGVMTLLLAVFAAGCGAEAAQVDEESIGDTSEALTARELHIVGWTTDGRILHSLRVGGVSSGFGDIESQAGEIGVIFSADAEMGPDGTEPRWARWGRVARGIRYAGPCPLRHSMSGANGVAPTLRRASSSVR